QFPSPKFTPLLALPVIATFPFASTANPCAATLPLLLVSAMGPVTHWRVPFDAYLATNAVEFEEVSAAPPKLTGSLSPPATKSLLPQSTPTPSAVSGPSPPIT